MGNGPTTETPATPVAPGAAQTLVLGAALNLVVTVRDLTGMPLQGARVVARVDGADGASGATDATGLVALRVTPRARLQARAELAGFTGATSPNITATFGGEAFVTLRLERPYAPRHLYAWQSAALRDRLYKRSPEDSEDPGTAEAEVDPNDRRDRSERLLQFIGWFGDSIGAPLPPAASAATDPELVRLREIRHRLQDTQADAADEGGLETEDEEAALRAEEEDVYLAENVDPGGSGHTRWQRNHDRASRDRERRRDRPAEERAAVRDALAAIDQLIGRRTATLSSHREIVDHIVHRMFGRDAQGAFPVWLRYMILHYSGLRYVNANSSYYPREYILIDLRLRALDRGEIGGDDERLRRYVGEARALLTGELARSVDREIRGTHREGAVALLDAAEAATAAPADTGSDRGRGHHAARATVSPRQAKLDALHVVHTALAEVWTSALTPGQAMSALTHRHTDSALPEASRLSDSEWRLAQYLTTLRADIEGPWRELGAAERPSRRRPRELFGREFQGSWIDRRGPDLSLRPWGAECNQISEIAARARGVVIDAGLSMGALSEAFQPRAPIPVPTEGAPPRDASRGLSGGTHVLATADGADAHRLWRPGSAAELQQGDVFFHMQWVHVSDSRNRPSNWVRPQSDMEWLGCPAFTGGEPEPHMEGEGSHAHLERPPPAGTGVDISTLETTTTTEDSARPPALLSGTGRREGSGYTRTSQKVLRGHPRAAHPYEVLILVHEGTVIATRGATVYTFETAGPTGVKFRNFGVFNTWEYVFGRPAAETESPVARAMIDAADLLGPHLED